MIAAPIGIFIGGDQIGDVIQGKEGQLHRYTRVFSLALGAQIAASLWIILVPFKKNIHKSKSQVFEGQDSAECFAQSENAIVQESKTSDEEQRPLLDKRQTSKTNREIEKIDKVLDLSLSYQNSGSLDRPIDFNKNSIEVRLPVTSPQTEPIRQSPEDMHWYDMFKDLFDLQNVRDLWHTCSKKRENGKRGEIWILVVSMTLITLTNNGALVIMFQFVQRVYEWDAQIFSIVNASTLLLTSVAVIVIVPFLLKVCKMSNMSLSIVGIISIYLQNLIRGSILNAEAFYVSYIFGSLAYVPPISVRSKLSTIVDQNEENKVFGLMATLETITPFVGSILYSTVFTATIAAYPGCVFQMSTAILLIPLIGFVYIANYCE